MLSAVIHPVPFIISEVLGVVVSGSGWRAMQVHNASYKSFTDFVSGVMKSSVVISSDDNWQYIDAGDDVIAWSIISGYVMISVVSLEWKWICSDVMKMVDPEWSNAGKGGFIRSVT